MTIKWFKDNESDLHATISNNNIVLNKQCEELFEIYEYCMLGYSETGKIIYIKPVLNDIQIEVDLYKLSFNRSYIRVSCTNFIKLISKTMFVDFSNNKKFRATWDENEKVLTIDLENKGGKI